MDVSHARPYDVWIGAMWVTMEGMDARAGVAAKVLAQTTQPTPLESARALPEEVLVQARDVIQGSARNVVRQPRASTPGQGPQLEDWEEEPPQPQAPPEPQQPQERQPMQLPPLPLAVCCVVPRRGLTSALQGESAGPGRGH